MDIRPIRTDADHAAALAAIDALWGAAPGTEDGNTLDVLIDLVEFYEDRNFPIPKAEPIDVLKAHMEATGRTQSDLATLFGSRPRASEVLNKRRSLTVDMIHRLNAEWGLPADCLVRPYETA